MLVSAFERQFPPFSFYISLFFFTTTIANFISNNYFFTLLPTEFLHVKPGKGAAFVRSKLKNFITGNTVDRTWRAGESVEIASVDKKESQFTYADGDEYVFMDMTTY